MKDKIKILIADDEPDILELLEYNFVKEGYEVYTVEDGSEVLPLAKKTNPDVIILDIMMPKKDGVEVCEILRSHKQFEDTIIVFLTARSEDYTQIACFENGGDDFITKPIKPKVLISRIKGIRRRNKGKQDNIKDLVSFGDVTIDMDKFQVMKNNKEIHLARKEYDLLLLLATKPGKLYTREEIFNKVWGVELMIGDRTIDVHIRKIREKIGDDLIKTIKGVGYKINDLILN